MFCVSLRSVDPLLAAWRARAATRAWRAWHEKIETTALCLLACVRSMAPQRWERGVAQPSVLKNKTFVVVCLKGAVIMSMNWWLMIPPHYAMKESTDLSTFFIEQLVFVKKQR